MVLINKQLKLSCHMVLMPIYDRHLIKPVMLICFSSAKFLLYLGVNTVPFSNDHNIVNSHICGDQNKPPMEFLDPFLHCLKVNLGSGDRCSKLLQYNEILPSIILKYLVSNYLRHYTQHALVYTSDYKILVRLLQYHHDMI